MGVKTANVKIGSIDANPYDTTNYDVGSTFRFAGIAEKRLELAENQPTIQGYSNGVFWERNTLAEQGTKKVTNQPKELLQSALFEHHVINEK
jgi:hypothetical protein